MTILVTGAAGFIGFHLAKSLLEKGEPVVGVDNLNSFYNPRLKRDRLAFLSAFKNFRFHKVDISDGQALSEVFDEVKYKQVFHLAALGGVTASSKNPELYLQANLSGFLNILECSRKNGAGHFVYASSSSVYGANSNLPQSARHAVDHPLSFYASTKRANELMAHAFSHIYQLPTTGLRFFTVYGPWGRPDMAVFRFTKAIEEGAPLEIFGGGEMKRDFTYIDDVIDGIHKASASPPSPNRGISTGQSPAESADPFRIYNIGCGRPISVLDLAGQLERTLGKRANKVFLPTRAEDLVDTHADITEMEKDFGFSPQTPLAEGLKRFSEWYRGYYKQP